MRNLLIIIILLLFTSCSLLNLGSKKITEKTSEIKQTEKIEIKNDSTSVEVVNKEIDDKASIKVAESNTGDRDFDEAVNRAVTNILSSINFEKSSGDNSYKMWYDVKEQMMKMEAKIGETKDKEVNTNKDKEVEKSWEQTVTENTKKTIKMIPWYLWIVIVWFLRKHLINLVGIFVPGVKQIKTVKQLLNPGGDNN